MHRVLASPPADAPQRWPLVASQRWGPVWTTGSIPELYEGSVSTTTLRTLPRPLWPAAAAAAAVHHCCRLLSCAGNTLPSLLCSCTADCLAAAAMADHKELEADLFGSSSDDEGPPPAEGGSGGGSEGEGQQADAKATTAALFGSSDEEEEQAGPSHPVTAALGEDEDEYEAGRCGLAPPAA